MSIVSVSSTIPGVGPRDFQGIGEQHEVDALSQARDYLNEEIAKRLPAGTEGPVRREDDEASA